MEKPSLVSKIKEFKEKGNSKKIEFISEDLDFVQQQIKEIENEKEFMGSFTRIVTCDYDTIFDADNGKEKYRINVYFHYAKPDSFGEYPNPYDLSGARIRSKSRHH